MGDASGLPQPALYDAVAGVAGGVVAPASPPKKRRVRPPKKSAPVEEGDYPIIAGTQENPVYGSMRMRVIEEKIVDGHKVKVLPPGYAHGAAPPKNVCVRS